MTRSSPGIEALADGVVSEMHSVLKTSWDRECLRTKVIAAIRAALPVEAAGAPYAVEYRIERDGHLYSCMHAGEPPAGAVDVRWLYRDVAQAEREPK